MNTHRTILVSLVCLFAFAGLTHAQPSIYVGGGSSATADGAAFNVTTGICTADTASCALINYSAHGSVKDLKSITYTTSAGIRRVIASTTWTAGTVELFALLDAGAAVAPDGPTFTGSGGGGITFHPARTPNWGVSFAAQGSYDQQNKQHANVFFQVGYTFHGTK